MVCNDHFRPFSPGERGVGDGQNTAAGQQEHQDQVGSKVEGGAAQSELATMWLIPRMQRIIRLSLISGIIWPPDFR